MDDNACLQGDEVAGWADGYALASCRIIQPDNQVSAGRCGTAIENYSMVIKNIFACAPARRGTRAVGRQRVALCQDLSISADDLSENSIVDCTCLLRLPHQCQSERLAANCHITADGIADQHAYVRH